MKRVRLNLVLCVIALGLICAVLLSQKKEAPKGAPLTALKADAVSHIVLHHPKAADIVLDKKDGKWALTAPVQVAADPFEVSAITSLAAATSKSSIDPKQVKLADLGLDPPAYDVTLNDVKIEFGGVQPLSYQRYVQTGGKVDLIDDPPASDMDADYSDLVAKKLLPDNAEIVSIGVPGLKLTRGADGKSWSADPADPKAGSDELHRFVDAWSGARALWNGAIPADVKPDPSPQTVSIALKDGSVLNYTIVGRDPQLVLQSDTLKMRYSLAKDDADKLLKLASPPPPPPAEPQKAAVEDKQVAAPAAAAADKK